jgi:hypothetical protein
MRRACFARAKISSMERESHPTPERIETYLRNLPRRIRWRLWLGGRRYFATRFLDRAKPLIVVAHSFRDKSRARQLALAIEQDWFLAPDRSREAYEEILSKAPGLVVVQLRRKNLCGCLGHRHVLVQEIPFKELHEAFRGESVGELDLAYDRIGTWAALPLSDGALDARYHEGTRHKEFQAQQFRLRVLSVFLHEVNHLVIPREPESSVRERSLAFYRESLAHYVESTISTLSFTIDRSFSRLG